MSAGLEMKNCPSEESLASFIDGRLDEAARRNMVEHMAQCAACRDTLLMADEIAAAGVVPRGGTVVRGRFPNRMIAAAAAAAVVLVFLIPDVREQVFGGGTGMRSLARAAKDYERRPSDARLNSAFEYREKPSRKRGEASIPLEVRGVRVQMIQKKLLDREASAPLSAADLHVLGLTHLLLGEREKAVVTLEAAVKRATAENDVARAIQACEDVTLLTDLVNAYLERQDPRSARVTADRAWQLKKSPVTAWNRAVTRAPEPPQEAKAAWQDYLELDSESQWADEAQERIAGLNALLLD